MPNYCECELWIEEGSNSGPVSKVVEALGGVGEDGEPLALDFNAVVPQPSDADWYAWRIKHWGCKWNAGDARIVEPYLVTFRTAWAPPLAWFRALVEKFPTYDFCLEWFERGMSFSGGLRWRAGVDGAAGAFSTWETTNYDGMKGG